MKGKKCIKYLILCITFLLSSNLYLNANAINMTSSLDYVGELNSGGWKCKIRDSRTGTLTESCTIPIPDNTTLTRYLDSIETLNTYTINKDYLYEIQLMVKVDAANRIPLPVITALPASDGAGFYVFDAKLDIVGQETQTAISTYTFHNDGTGQTDTNAVSVEIYPQQTLLYSIFLKATSNSNNAPVKISRDGQHIMTIRPGDTLVQPPIIVQPIYRIKVWKFGEDNASEEMNQKDNEDRDNLETQQGESESSADDSSDSFESNTTNITGVISGFVTSLNNLQVGNCTLPEISAYGFSLGNINLCTFTPPTWIQGVTTVIISLITLGLAWHVFRRIMGIAKSIAGSK